jgi:hypothetical protein
LALVRHETYQAGLASACVARLLRDIGRSRAGKREQENGGGKRYSANLHLQSSDPHVLPLNISMLATERRVFAHQILRAALHIRQSGGGSAAGPTFGGSTISA